MREVLSIEFEDVLLHGTLHTGTAVRSTGILFLNSGAQPRCSRGDLYAHLADGFAERGFPCFRVDLPGLGDSGGELPRDFATFYQLVQEGAYAPCVQKLVGALRTQYHLDGIVLLGICGGALTAVFAAAASESKDGITGLVLLDLPFTYVSVRGETNGGGRPALESVLGRFRRRSRRWKSGLHDWVLAQSWEPYATALYHRLQGITRMSHGPEQAMPPNTNHRLLRAFGTLLEQGLPALLITAHPTASEPAAFDFIGHLGHRAGHVIDHVKIRETTHSFVENGGGQATFAAIATWLKRFENSMELDARAGIPSLALATPDDGPVRAAVAPHP